MPIQKIKDSLVMEHQVCLHIRIWSKVGRYIYIYRLHDRPTFPSWGTLRGMQWAIKSQSIFTTHTQSPGPGGGAPKTRSGGGALIQGPGGMGGGGGTPPNPRSRWGHPQRQVPGEVRGIYKQGYPHPKEIQNFFLKIFYYKIFFALHWIWTKIWTVMTR